MSDLTSHNGKPARVVVETLSDGSHVFNVEVRAFAVYPEDHAQAVRLANIINAAAEMHDTTNAGRGPVLK